MRNFKYIFVLFVFIISLKADILNEYKIGLNLANYNKISKNRMKHLVYRLINEVRPIMKDEVEVYFFNNDKALITEFERFKKMNLIVVSSDFYLKNSKKLQEISKMPFLFNKEERNQFYLIVNKKSNINTLDNLNGKKGGFFVGDETDNKWLDYILITKVKRPFSSLDIKKKFAERPVSLVLDVYFKKLDFAVVSKVIYDNMIELNPSIKKKITILEKSKPIFFLAIGLFHKNTPDNLVSDFYKLLDNGEFNLNLGFLYKLLNLYGMQRSSFEDLKEVDNFYEEYLQLKKSM
ncbi:MAG: phosphate/phosphite/phosphonate ABC transporter substrate-binding protein [Arcobacter sp.]|nr:phosphate/phosphite/phosphonate ABC transporter substrate-binding protein [Arcobacter sp.]